MRIGIFGGSFDPVHRGHVHLAEKLLKKHSLDRVYFVPVKRSPFKTQPPEASSKHRLKMLNLAIAGRPRLMISKFEISRPAPSFTIRTLRHFRAKFPRAELFLLLGVDARKGVKKWRAYPEIAEKCRFISCARFGKISSSEARETIRKGKSTNAMLLPAVRKYIDQNGIYSA